LSEWFADLKAQFILNFIDDNRWRFLVRGLGVTLEVTLFAVLVGVVIGVVIAIVRSTFDKNAGEKHRGIGWFFLRIVNFICKLYLTVIRGTPVVVQLMIIYYIILASFNNKIVVAILAFGINSGAYVAEIIRSGIMSVDSGSSKPGAASGSTMCRLCVHHHPAGV
jgi:ABC-type amino acid transport system permease subunit